jgi:hypothetical protein
MLASERPQIHALDREATGNSFEYYDEIRRKRDGEGRTVSKYGKEEKYKVTYNLKTERV